MAHMLAQMARPTIPNLDRSTRFWLGAVLANQAVPVVAAFANGIQPFLTAFFGLAATALSFAMLAGNPSFGATKRWRQRLGQRLRARIAIWMAPMAPILAAVFVHWPEAVSVAMQGATLLAIGLALYGPQAGPFRAWASIMEVPFGSGDAARQRWKNRAADLVLEKPEWEGSAVVFCTLQKSLMLSFRHDGVPTVIWGEKAFANGTRTPGLEERESLIDAVLETLGDTWPRTVDMGGAIVTGAPIGESMEAWCIEQPTTAHAKLARAARMARTPGASPPGPP